MTRKVPNLAELEAEKIAELRQSLANLKEFDTWSPELPEENMSAASHPRHKGRGNWFQAVCFNVHLAVEAATALGLDDVQERALTEEINEAFSAYKQRREDATQDPEVKGVRTVPEEIESVSQMLRNVVNALEPLLPSPPPTQ